MRVIVFRGKSPSGWKYGDLLQYHDEAYIFDTHLKVANSVDSETVGQYTGLIDRNDEMIFEGDIIVLPGVRWNDLENKPLIVAFHDGTFGYIEPEQYFKDNGEWFPSFNDSVHGMDTEWDAEIIGNIYDNPELIGR